MRNRYVAALVALALVGCKATDGGLELEKATDDELEIGQVQEALLWAACVPQRQCPSVENCEFLEPEEPCYRQVNDDGSGGFDPEYCTSYERCCRDLPCIHGNELEDKHYKVTPTTPGCRTDRQCVQCPPGQLRSSPSTSGIDQCESCCTAQGRKCGPPSDSAWCGTASCGTCAAGETCSASGCCRNPPSAACAGRICGSAPDKCGGSYNCGTCPSIAYGTRTCVAVAGGTACAVSCTGGRYYCEERDRCLLPTQVCNL